MRMTKYLILLVAILSAPTYAVTDQERSVLQRLRADLQKIQQGIFDAANTVRREPRSLPQSQMLVEVLSRRARKKLLSKMANMKLR